MTLTNVESKVPCSDLEAVAGHAASAGADFAGVLRQRDTYFAVSDHRLKLRELLHRAPDGTTSEAAELIGYERADRSGARVSAYTRERVEDPAARVAALAAEHGLRGAVTKRRDLWLLGRTRIHLDRVAGLGEFVELETVADSGVGPAEWAEHERIAAALGLDLAASIAFSYIDLIEAAIASE